MDYDEEFGAPWWTPERVARVGRTIESAVNDTMRELAGRRVDGREIGGDARVERGASRG